MLDRIEYREVRKWEGPKMAPRRDSRFKRTVNLEGALLSELRKIRATEAVVYGFWRHSDFKRSGGVYAEAKPTEPGVVLEYVCKAVRYRFQADLYRHWADNLEGIVRTLENLRAIDRWGVSSGRQMEGFRALPPGGAESAAAGMSQLEAEQFVAELANVPIEMVQLGGRPLDMAIRSARQAAHPDTGGDHETFTKLDEAVRVLCR